MGAAGARSDAAATLRDGRVSAGTTIYVPDLHWAEAANVLWRLTRSGRSRLEAVEARELFEVLRATPLATEPAGPVAGRALGIACAAGLTAYDATYVALAELRSARLWTADAGLVRRLSGTEWTELASSL